MQTYRRASFQVALNPRYTGPEGKWHEGYVTSLFAIDKRHKNWHITHLPSGLRVTDKPKTMAQAKNICSRLLALPVDWTGHTKLTGQVVGLVGEAVREALRMTQEINKSEYLTDREKEAVTWAKSCYHHWRKRFSETREQFDARRPSGWSPEAWGNLYLNPFGDSWMNWNVAAVRRLLNGGRI